MTNAAVRTVNPENAGGKLRSAVVSFRALVGHVMAPFRFCAAELPLVQRCIGIHSSLAQSSWSRRAMTALIVLRNKGIEPCWLSPGLSIPLVAHNSKPIDANYQTIQGAMRSIFH